MKYKKCCNIERPKDHRHRTTRSVEKGLSGLDNTVQYLYTWSQRQYLTFTVEVKFISFFMNNTYKLKKYELPHDKTDKMAFTPSENSDHPGHPPSPIRVFAVRMKKAWALSCPLSAQRSTLIRLGGCPG